MKGTVKILHRFPFFKADDIENIRFDDEVRPSVVWQNGDGMNMALPEGEEGPVYVYGGFSDMYHVTRVYRGTKDLLGKWPSHPFPWSPEETEIC